MSGTTMGALDSSIETLKIMKAKMIDTSSPDHEMNLAVCGVTAILVFNLLKICNKVILESLPHPDANARDSVVRIRDIFMNLMDEIINHE